jgi:hypothetical protein
MPWHTVICGTSADRSAADVNIPVAAGERSVQANGVPGTATGWYPPYKGYITCAFVRSETAAMVETWFHKTDDADRMKLVTAGIQTDTLRAADYNYLSYPVDVGDTIYAAGENAGAVLDMLGLCISPTGDEYPSFEMPGPLPPGARLVRATHATTMGTDTVTEATLTFDDFTPLRDVRYNIIGFAADAASAGIYRLKFFGDDQKSRPGVIAADTSTHQEYAMSYAWKGGGWGSFGSFLGQNVPTVEGIQVAGDTAGCFYFVLVPSK